MGRRMIKDFLTYIPGRVHELEFKLPGSENIARMVDDAKSMDSFLKFHVTEMGPLSKVDGVWFTVTLMFTDQKDAVWYRLKWA